MATRFGVSLDGASVYLVTNTPEEALAAAVRDNKADGVRRWVVRLVTLKRITSVTPPPPEPLVEDE